MVQIVADFERLSLEIGLQLDLAFTCVRDGVPVDHVPAIGRERGPAGHRGLLLATVGFSNADLTDAGTEDNL